MHRKWNSELGLKGSAHFYSGDDEGNVWVVEKGRSIFEEENERVFVP